ncbi:hypothetical protein D3C78_1135370 [compost metagenome]
MVGASRTSVMRSRAMVSSTTFGTKDGSTTWVPPVMNSAVMAEKSARWNIGITCRYWVCARQLPPFTTPREEKATLVWLSITPFGNPVVPPV